MSFGYCFLSVVPLRKEPLSSSEQISQLIFGDCVEIIDKRINQNNIANSWLKIKNLADNYVGWVDWRQILLIDDAILPAKYIIKSFVAKIKMDEKEYFIGFGSHVIADKWIIGEHKFEIDKKDIISPMPFSPTKLQEVVQTLINCPYQWGGKSVFGMDCSGFTQLVFSFFGENLLRDAHQQVEQGKEIDFNDLQTGDLCFFAKLENRISHVGIYLGNNKIAHCSSQVRIDYLDAKGIKPFDNKDLYSHKLVKIIRYFY